MAETRIFNGAVAHPSWSEPQRDAVAEEMNRILDHPTFKSSKQCVALLHYLIEHVLDGNHEGVKERTLGVEVFGRDPDYDTNTDPIVRRTAKWRSACLAASALPWSDEPACTMTGWPCGGRGTLSGPRTLRYFPT